MTDRLVVEGKSDQDFFKFLINKRPNLQHIEISPPIPLGSKNDGATGILEKLPDLLKFKEFGGNLGIILDADFLENDKKFEKGRFKERRNSILEILKKAGYVTLASPPNNKYQGELFPHEDEGLTPVGLWIMPDHYSRGMLETLLLDTVQEGKRQDLFNRIKSEINSVTNLKCFNEIRFKDAHIDKILLNTWLNWQNQPSVCKSDSISIVECALQQQWLNPDHENILNLVKWLETVFKNNENA